MDVFSEQGGGPSPSASEIKTARFVWDSSQGDSFSGNNPTFTAFGNFGTAGKRIGTTRVRMLTSSFNPNFVPVSGADVIALTTSAAQYNNGNVFFGYSDSFLIDPLTTDGWQVPNMGIDVMQVDTFDHGIGPIDIGWFAENGVGGAFNLTGRIEIIVEWVESL